VSIPREVGGARAVRIFYGESNRRWMQMDADTATAESG